ncbi:MAG: response regulator, partial [Fibrobacteria bacterium]|nr:response regulator [Fibrobacteria bacterium]
CDIRMPGKDGIEILKEIKEQSEFTEVIMITGHGGVETAVKALQGGAFSYLQKPIDYDEMEIEIKRVLEKQETQARLSSHIQKLEQALKEKDNQISSQSTTSPSDETTAPLTAAGEGEGRITSLEKDLARVKHESKFKSHFLAVISHEIRTPVNGILGFLELFKETTLDSQQKEYLQNLIASGEILSRLINDIQDLSGVDEDKVNLNLKDFDLKTLMENVKKDLKSKSEDNSEQQDTSSKSQDLSFQGLKVLVAEDNAINQQFISKYLKRLGCEVDLAENGKQAYQKVSLNEYDLCLMDVMMPEMDGIDATREIRKNQNEDLPILALTANAMEGDKEKCLLAGMNDYLSKPINPETLKEKIIQWVKQ